MEKNQLYAPRAGYDGNKSLYSPSPLVPHGDGKPLEAHKWTNLPVPEEGDGPSENAPRYDVEFKKVNEIDMDDLVRFTNGQSPDNEAVQVNALLLGVCGHEPID